jgi:hypothetical protein
MTKPLARDAIYHPGRSTLKLSRVAFAGTSRIGRIGGTIWVSLETGCCFR